MHFLWKSKQGRRAAGMEENNRIILPQATFFDLSEHSGEGFGGVDRIEQNPFKPGEVFQRILAF
jgi:hypothetical protein